MISEEIIFYFFSIFCIMVSMATSTKEQWAKKYMAETRLFKDYFYTSFVKISAVALQ